jgi:solute carrier family 35 protein
MANMLLGFSASNHMNLAMFSALRRVSVLMTLFAQWYLSKQTFSFSIVASVNIMVAGSLLAMVHDKTFELEGYILVMLHNMLTTASQIVSKSAMDNGLDKECLLFYSEMSTALVSLTCCFSDMHSVTDFEHWTQLHFVVVFVLSTILTPLVHYSTWWVLEENSPLTLAMSTSIKSGVMCLMVCLGLFDQTYKWSLLNFVGLQLSTVASLFYVYTDHIHSKDKIPVSP